MNQDFVASREPAGPEEEKRHGWLYILADGAGGMDAGEVASQFATERALHHYFESTEEDFPKRLVAALQAANNDLRALGARRNGGSRMATTMVAVVIHDGIADIANVGDSRAYHWRAGKLQQITRDQSLVAQLLAEGAISEEEAAVHPHRHVVLYSIGSDRSPRIDLYQLSLEPDDVLLLCSDGLTRHVEDAEIEALLAKRPDTGEAAETLVNLANERGGQDNISVTILRYTPGDVSKGGTVVQPAAETRAGRRERVARGALWFYTAFLAIVQTLLIFLVWLFLRV